MRVKIAALGHRAGARNGRTARASAVGSPDEARVTVPGGIWMRTGSPLSGEADQKRSWRV